MKVLIVCSGNVPPGQVFDLRLHHSFIYEQVGELKKLGVEFDFFYITEKGLRGYLKSIFVLQKKLRIGKYDLIHAHYGLSGIVATFQRKFPLVVTFHGSDINRKDLNIISSFAALLSRANIFVSDDLLNKIIIKTPLKNRVIPCGTDMDLFFPIDKLEARKALKLDMGKYYILFSSAQGIPVKNWSLARTAVDHFPSTELLEISEKSREEVNLLMNACDLFLMTSFTEGSPLTIKEAMATNCPIVSSDVGDVQIITGSTEGCYICSFEVEDVVNKIRMAMDFTEAKGRTNGRQRIVDLGIDSVSVAKRVLAVYKNVFL